MSISLKDIESGLKFVNRMMKQGEKFIDNGRSFIDKVSQSPTVQNNPNLNMASAVGKFKLDSYKEKVKRINGISTEKLKHAKKVLENVINDREGEKDKNVIDAEYTEVK